MKLSSNFIGAIIFTALAVVAFVWMAMRPAVEGNAMSFGMPVQSEVVAEVLETVPNPEIKTEEVIEPEKTEEMNSQNIPASNSSSESMPTEEPTTAPVLPTN